MTNCYARLLVHHPYAILFIITALGIAVLLISCFLSKGFDFEEPQAGFEARGTEISNRAIAFKNLQDARMKSLSLVASIDRNRFRYDEENTTSSMTKSMAKKRKKNDERVKKKKLKKKKKRKWKEGKNMTISNNNNNKKNKINKNKSKNKKTRLKKDKKKKRRKYKIHQQLKNATAGYFCTDLDDRYVRIVFKTCEDCTLFSLDNIQAMCRLERRVIYSTPLFKDIPIDDSRECRSWSIGNYISLLSNKSSCEALELQDVAFVLDMLKECAKFYRNYSFSAYCYDCVDVPYLCKQHDAVYHILHYLTDTEFTSISTEHLPTLKYAVSFLPIRSHNPETDNLFEHIEKQNLHEDNVELIGAYFGIKNFLFTKYLWSDSIWIIVTAVSIFLSIWFYSLSLFITFMTFLAIFWSLIFAYFFYIFILGIEFFPYLNMVTLMIMVGIGADDTFIYCRLWSQAKIEKKDRNLEEMVTITLRHAVMSMLVSSLTTAAAFLANAISDIIAIRCFSIYVGTSVMCNFFLMVTWMPATIVLYENHCSKIHCTGTVSKVQNFSCHGCKFLSNISQKFFKEFLPNQIVKYWYIFLLFFGMLGIASAVTVFFYPGVRLPTKEKFQYFSSNHLLEAYDLELSNHFWFEKEYIDWFQYMPIAVVWGIMPKDNGHILNPYDSGTLEFDNNFSLESAAAQTWLMDFCGRIRQQPFYQNTPGEAITNCFFENFRNYMRTPCIGKHRKLQGCCNITDFPYSAELLKKCLEVYIPILMNTPYIGPYYYKHLSGPRFQDEHMRAFSVKFSSTTPYTFAYEKLHMFYSEVNEWVQKEMKGAPHELSRGWFISHLGFYDLQNSILHGLPIAMALSLGVAGAVIFLTTLNVLLSIYAMFSVTFTILTTIAFLILLGWELNILESLVITIAIGMSIDFTLHYSVAYRLSTHTERNYRVISSISSVGSAIAMASFTTFLAGLLMYPATVLVFRQFGIFLMIITSSSWLYATFFFQSLLCVLGPRGNFSQFYWHRFNCCLKFSPESDPSPLNESPDDRNIELSNNLESPEM